MLKYIIPFILYKNLYHKFLPEFYTGTKNSNFVEDHPRNIPAKFGSNRPCGFGEEA
jgi:hypothetical protein